jgi:glycosyltransferase involved in cell wall biosynthesis
MADNKPSATLIIPVYNEYPAISEFFKNLFEYPFIKDLELLIIDDGSIDGSSKILEDLCSNRSHVTLIKHEQQKGYGASLKTGINQASTDSIIITDADGSYPNDRIPQLLEIFKQENISMVVGARTSPEARAKIPWLRRMPKWILNKIANILSGQKIPDINSGLRIFNRQIAIDNMNLLCDDFSFTTTITLLMLTQNHTVKYVPISYHKRLGRSKIHPLRDPINFLILILTTVLYFKPLKVLFPIAIFFLLTGGIIAFFQAIILQNITTAAMLLTATGFNVLILSLIADLIVKSRNS